MDNHSHEKLRDFIKDSIARLTRDLAFESAIFHAGKHEVAALDALALDYLAMIQGLAKLTADEIKSAASEYKMRNRKKTFDKE